MGYDLELEKPEADAWLRTTFNLPSNTDLNGLGELVNNQRINRISAFYDLGLFKEAINEAELLRAEFQTDAVKFISVDEFSGRKKSLPACNLYKQEYPHISRDGRPFLIDRSYLFHAYPFWCLFQGNDIYYRK